MILIISVFPSTWAQNPSAGFHFRLLFLKSVCKEPLDGRLLLIISSDDSREPRFQINPGPRTQLIFGIDIQQLKPGEEAVIDASVFGYPLESITDIPAGEYQIQALIHRYETFHRADGHTVKMPMDRGEGQRWNRAPGNLFSTPRKIHLDPNLKKPVTITLDQVIAPIPPPKDTKYIKHIKMKSKLLSEFWGRPMHLGGVLLLPQGHDTHPEAHYPLMVNHGHFPYTFRAFRELPPDPSAGMREKRYQEYAHRLYKKWTDKDFPRVIILLVQHANPFYDDSYAVNSANVGPYGDAITYELIPYIEKKFRGIGEGWARALYGGSTGGWEALAVQIFYPDEYNGCWASCPDPIDFRAYSIVNIYEHVNAYYMDSPWKKTARPGRRNSLGEISSTMEDENHMELVLGPNSRSGGQLDIWQAVYSPVGPDGYPKPIWDKRSGIIDSQVAAFWKGNYDLRYILQRDWKVLGPRLKGKINIAVGDMDTFYLNNAVYLIEAFLESTKDPYYEGQVIYGDREVHCWGGNMDDPDTGRRMTSHEYFIPVMVDHIVKTAPPGADVTSWRY